MHDAMRFHRNLTVVVAVIALAAIVTLYLCLPDQPAWALGLLLGSVVGLGKFQLDGLAIHRVLQQAEAGQTPSGGMGFRGMAMVIGALLGAYALQPHVSMWTALAGVYLPNAVCIGYALLRPSILMPGHGGGQAATTGPVGTAAPAGAGEGPSDA